MRRFDPYLANVRRVGLVLLLALMLVAVPQTAQAEWRPRYTLLAEVNERRSPDLRLADWGTRLNDVARIHSLRMRDQGRVFHSDFRPCWYRGENVGAVGVGRLASIVDAFMKSSPHRANIINPNFRRIGIGVAVGDGIIYVTMIFCA